MKSGRQELRAIGFAVLGFVYAFATLFMAWLMTGAGHGWMSGAASGYGLFILPFVGASLAYRDQKLGIVLLSIGLIGAIAGDYSIIQGTQEEGASYLHKVQRAMPEEYNRWLVMWSAWQVAVVYLLPKSIYLYRRKARVS